MAQVISVAGDITGSLTSNHNSIYLGAGSIGAGVVISALFDMTIYSFSSLSVNVGVGSLFRLNNVSITTWGSYSGQIDACENVNVVAQQDISSGASIKSSFGSISVTADNVKGNLETIGDLDDIGEPSGSIAEVDRRGRKSLVCYCECRWD